MLQFCECFHSVKPGFVAAKIGSFRIASKSVNQGDSAY